MAEAMGVLYFTPMRLSQRHAMRGDASREILRLCAGLPLDANLPTGVGVT